MSTMMYLIPLVFVGYFVFLLINWLRKKSHKNNDKAEMPVVENERLVYEMGFGFDPKNYSNAQALSRLITVAKGTYLGLSNDDQEIFEEAEDGSFELKEKDLSRLHLIRAENKIFLPLFTDRENLEKYTKSKTKGFVFPGKAALAFVEKNTDKFDGIIINPAEQAFALGHQELQYGLDGLNKTECIEEIVYLIQDSFAASNETLKPEDILLAVGNLTGMFILLSVFDDTEGLDISTLEPGSVFLSEEANQRGESFFNKLVLNLMTYGYGGDMLKPSPNTYNSNLSYLDIIGDIQKPAMEIVKKHGFNNVGGANAAIHSASEMLRHLEPHVEMKRGLGIVLYGMVEGCKTVPLR